MGKVSDKNILSSCDIYFDENSHSLKNHEEEIIAFYENQQWNLTENASAYCKEYQEAIKTLLKTNPNASPENLLIELRQMFSEVKSTKIEEDELLKDAAIALDLNPQDVKQFQKDVAQILSNLNIVHSKIRNPHVSTAYLMGYHRYSDLAETLKTISNYSYEFTVAGLEILKGATTNKDYLVLKLNPPENFYKALKLIEQNKETVKFPGGFKTHISLFGLDTKSLTVEKIEQLKQELNKTSLTLNHQVKIKPQAVSLFNNSRLLELRHRLRQAMQSR